MVALEAWGLGRPVLANGRCDVLRGQAIRSRAGLYYDDFAEFAEALFTLTSNRALNAALGDNGRRFYERHYAWPVIQRKYEGMLTQLSRAGATASAPIDPLPGWLARRRRTLPPARELVEQLPKGAVSYEEPAVLPGHQGRPPSASPLPRPSPTSGRQAIRRGDARGRGPRPHATGKEQGGRPDGQRQDREHRQDRAAQPQGGRQAQGQGQQGGNQGQGQKGGRDRNDRRQQRHGRHRRPPRRNNG
jgi:hypothetical protein